MPSQTVLVVDDEESNRDLLSQRLGRRGYRVIEAANGEDALDIVAREKIDLVLLDVMMPEMDGIEVLRILRRTHPPLELPIIMVTALAESDDVVRALASGANDHVAKPIDFAILLARLETQLLNRRAVMAARAPAPVASTPDVTALTNIGPGTLVEGKYRIEARVGAGGFGAVYRALHVHLDRLVAVKFLEGPWADKPDTRERFRREGVSACRVHHPNAVLVLDFGVVGEVAYLVMELLAGESLADELDRHPRLSARRALEIATPVAGVLAAAHKAGIVHRDIKPANVFLHKDESGETVKVLDFGIAKLLGMGETTAPGMVIGTPEYMAPERFRGVSGEPALDVYSFGTMLYRMLGGSLPFVCDSLDAMEIADEKLSNDAPPLGPLCPQVPADVVAWVMRSLARDPHARPTAAELSQAFASQLARELAAPSAPTASRV